MIPTSNHNLKYDSTIIYWLYIFWFLHQTTTHFHRDQGISCCISFDSYIKPQLSWVNVAIFRVVYLLIPTSNHNSLPACALKRLVVYLLIPTSNHNHGKTTVLIQELYIFWFLHQTTTYRYERMLPTSCISFDSYIKPQPTTRTQIRANCCISFDSYIKPQRYTISNLRNARCISFDSYIKPQHIHGAKIRIICCISFDSYIKPQRC